MAVHVFQKDPDLLSEVDADRATELKRQVRAETLRLPAGEWKADYKPPHAGHLGLLVVEGWLLRSVTVNERRSLEVVGPGDVLRPWVELRDLSVPFSSGWTVHRRATLAMLDYEFARRVAAWPEIVEAICDRLVARSRWLALELAISNLKGVDSRVLMALWHLADRWGRVTHDGVVLDVPIKHELLADIVGARRPSVTTALGALQERRMIDRTKGRIVLCGGPPDDLGRLDADSRVGGE